MESNDGMFPLTINIKKEKFDPSPQTISRVDFTSDSHNKLSIDVNISNIVSYEKEKKVSIEPLKSSNEILTELFKVFNAAPPENLLTTSITKNSNNEDGGDKKSSQAKKSKKHKHKKKKHKSKKDKDSPESVKKGADESSNEESKDKPNRKHSLKKEDIDDKKSKKKKKKRDKSESIASDKEKAIIGKSRKLSDADSLSENERATKCKHRKSKNSESLSDNETSKYKVKKRSNSDSLSENEVPSRHKHRKHKNGDLLSENEVLSRNTHSHEEYHYKDRDFYKSYESAIKLKDSKSNRKYNSSSSRSKEYQDYSKKSHYRDRERLSSRSRSRSRSTDIHSEKIDKKRLLEIARKNAITMMKNGSLPGNLVADEKNKLISNMRYEGKSVAELTEYCKKLSNCESLGDLSNISSDGDSDHDKHGNEKAFNHPFQIKDRGPIIMNIKNSTPLPPKTAQQNKAIILQFPVSSGKQHRVNENEWVPVSPKRTAVTPAPAPVPKSTPTPPQEPVVIPPKVIVEPTYGTQVSPPMQTLCPPPNPPLLPYNSETKSTVFEDMSVFYSEEQQRTTFAYPKPTDTSVFPNFEQDCNLDVAQIIAQRLNAMRKLQDNPTDEGAKQLLNNAQKDMSTWASSKFTPGQFLGSHSDANILTPKELSSGYTPWAKKDQLITTNPVSGMGMHLLQKMGWRPGEGLGKDKSGSLQPLLLEVKLDKRGLVAEEENPRLKKPVPKVVPQLRKTLDGKHPVSLLGELSSKRKWGPPQYDVVMECGPGHAKSFIFKVRLNGVDYQPSIASNNKKDAKATAAKFCLQHLGFLPT